VEGRTPRGERLLDRCWALTNPERAWSVLRGPCRIYVSIVAWSGLTMRYHKGTGARLMR
jgi:hypothetical protein